MQKTKLKKSVIVGFLAIVMIFSCTIMSSSANAATPAWMQESLTKLTDWGVLKGYPDGKMHENDPVTRAQFVAMINRAFGYSTKASKTPFKDVNKKAWYADDISIAYNAGYFTGTSKTTASPNAALTREQAVTILARNLRLEETPGQIMDFTDGDDFASWSRGYIKSAVADGLINGYADGSFKPGKVITRGEMAKVLAGALGNLVNTNGARSLGGVFSNVTLNTPGAILRDTTIGGNLYLTGGVGLGDVILENVKVLGKIVVIGGGESQDGTASITMRNVTANELIVDNMDGQYVSLSVDGDSFIRNATVKSSAYINDNTDDDHGIRFISLEAPSGSSFNLSGNVKSVSDCTPSSVVKVSKGSIANLTVDEKAAGSEVVFSNNAKTTQLNLDTATKVTGKGDIGKLDIAAPDCEIEMLPDELTIRPGVTAKVDGEEYGSSDASEISDTPRILAGYPKTTLLTSNSITPVFQTNKRGTIYWVIAYTASPTIKAEDIISPPADNSYILKSGSIAVTASNKDTSTKVTGLVVGGKYTLYSILVDSHNWESPVKSLAFQTTDDSVPAFTTGYPYMSLLTAKSAPPQVFAMTTKDCIMYYALMPANSTAPSSAEFLAGSLSGAISSGTKDMKKNIADYVDLEGEVEESTKYDLYLWLIDNDGAKSSAIKKLSFETKDETPPKFEADMVVTSIKATSLDCFCILNEEGTVYWTIVKENTEYPRPAKTGETTIALTDDYAKLQITSGMYAIKYGKVAAKALTNVKITISGLDSETAYDIYYVAVDKAGNYSEKVEKLSANTLDSIAPTVTQEFSKVPELDPTTPFPDTTITLHFSENIKEINNAKTFAQLFSENKDDFAKSLANTISIYSISKTGEKVRVNSYSDSQTDWVVNYKNVDLKLSDGKLDIVFPSSEDSTKSALNLKAGATYFFQCENICDCSSGENKMPVTTLPTFSTISAQVAITQLNEYPNSSQLSFTLTPESASNADPSIDYDVIIWSDTTITFDLYRRKRADANIASGDWGTPTEITIFVDNEAQNYVGKSVSKELSLLQNNRFPMLNQFKDTYDYAIKIKKINSSTDESKWSQEVNIKVNVVSGSTSNLSNLSNSINDTSFTKYTSSKSVTIIGEPSPFILSKQFTDTAPPTLLQGFPSFDPSDITCDIDFFLDGPGTIYYLIAPTNVIIPKDKSGNTVTTTAPNGMELSYPTIGEIINPSSNQRCQSGKLTVGNILSTASIYNLEPSTDYYVYIVTKGSSDIYSEYTKLFYFRTDPETIPSISIQTQNATATITSSGSGILTYILDPLTEEMFSILDEPFSNYAINNALSKGCSQKILNGNVYDALTELYTDYSYFDTFATDEAKNTLYKAITVQDSNKKTVHAIEKNINITKGDTIIDCSNKDLSKIDYYFLALVQNRSKTGYCFFAAEPITTKDHDAPEITSVESTITYNGSSASGNIIIDFDENICYYITPQNSNKASKKSIDRGPATGGTETRKASFISCTDSKIFDNYDDATRVKMLTNKDLVNQETNRLVIQFSNITASSSASASITSNLCDAQYNKRDSNITVTVSIKNGDVDVKFKDGSTYWDVS